MSSSSRVVERSSSPCGGSLRWSSPRRACAWALAPPTPRSAGFLAAQGLALRNLASLAHVTVAGAVATGTHGAGQKNEGLAAAVCHMELVDGRGRLWQLRGRQLKEALVHLGCLGVVTKLTLRVVPQFEIRQRCFDLRLSQIAAQEALDKLLGAGYSVSLFTQWEGKDVERLGAFQSMFNPFQFNSNPF